MKRFLILIFCLIACIGYADAIRQPSGFALPSTGGGGSGEVDANITGQTEVIATFGENITAGDAIVGRVFRTYDYNVGSLTALVTDAFPAPPSGNSTKAGISPNGLTAVVGLGASANVLVYNISPTGATSYNGTLPLISGTLCYHAFFTPQGDKMLTTGPNRINIWDVTYTNNVATMTVASPSTVDIQPVGNAVSGVFNASGSLLAVNHATTPWLSIYKRTNNTFVKLANADVLPGTVTAGRCQWSPSGKELFVPIGASGVAIYSVNESTGTVTKRANIAGLTSVDYVTLVDNGRLLHCGRSTTSPSMYELQVTYTDGVSTVASLTTPAGDTIGVSYEAVFLDNALIIGRASPPYYRMYRVSYPGGVATLTQDLTTSFSPGGGFSYWTADARFVLPTSGGTPFYGLYRAQYNTTATLASESFFIYKPDVISDYWLGAYFGYAKESGLAGEAKTVIKFPEGY